MTDLHNIRIYLAEADESVRVSLASYLKSRGARVSTFASSSELDEEALEPERACLLIDLELKEGTGGGAELLSELRARGVRCPAFLMSGKPYRLLPPARKTGPVIMKPLEGDHVAALVAAAIYCEGSKRAGRTADAADEIRAAEPPALPASPNMVRLSDHFPGAISLTADRALPARRKKPAGKPVPGQGGPA